MHPVIFGLSGPRLTPDEKAFFKEADPAGIILFGRNIETPDQVRALTDEVRQALGRDLLVLIDQEGGRVQRLGPPYWREAPAMGFFGTAYEVDPVLAQKALLLNTVLILSELKLLGINVDCLPVLDVPVEGADNVIGDRAFSKDPEIVARLGKVVLEGFQETGMLPVMKHIPGHGRASVDSHKALPVVDTGLEELEKTDFVPFRALAACPFAMTAHVIYSALDPDDPATLSKTVIEEVIRGKIGFEGALVSDDITMKALSGTPKEITGKCLAAGIDLVLHCNGRMADMEAVLAGAGRPSARTVSALGNDLPSPKAQAGDLQELATEYKGLEYELRELMA